MPDPNQWGVNPWWADLGRETAADQSRLGPDWQRWADAVLRSQNEAALPDTSDPEDSTAFYAPQDAFQSLVADWPTVSFPYSDHIRTRADSQRIYEYWNVHWRNPKKPDDIVHCFDRANFQLHIDGFRTTGDPHDMSTYYQLFLEGEDDDGRRLDTTDVPRTIEGIEYLKATLQQNIPVQVGLRSLGYQPRPNPDDTTNHFVVIVGMGQETIDTVDPLQGPTLSGVRHFFAYLDSNKPGEQKFYLYNFPTLALMTNDGDSRVSQIRRTARE